MIRLSEEERIKEREESIEKGKTEVVMYNVPYKVDTLKKVPIFYLL